MSHCVDDRLVCRFEFQSNQTIIHTSDMYVPDVLIQLVLLVMGTWLPDIENRNKYT